MITTNKHTISHVLGWGASTLRASLPADDARTDSRVLLAAAVGRPLSWLIAHEEAEIEPVAFGKFQEFIARRAAGVPVAYILGRREFWSLELEVTPDVLVPRPETEVLVEEALKRLRPGEPATVLDLGTGSGAVALAIAHERPEVTVVATDSSAAALEVARRNAARLGLGNVSFRRGDWFGAVGAEERFDAIVSNPPYIAAGDPALGQPELRAEPAGALSPGPSGLEAIEKIASAAPGYLERGGWLAVEHGADQGPAVRELFTRAGLVDVRTGRDLEGRDRITVGTVS